MHREIELALVFGITVPALKIEAVRVNRAWVVIIEKRVAKERRPTFALDFNHLFPDGLALLSSRGQRTVGIVLGFAHPSTCARVAGAPKVAHDTCGHVMNETCPK